MLEQDNKEIEISETFDTEIEEVTVTETEETAIVEEEEEVGIYIENLEAAVEAILFSMGDSMELDRIADALSIEVCAVEDIIENLIEKYEKPESGLMILKLEDRVQLCTKRQYYEVLKKIVGTGTKYRLTDTVLETLSIIAYKQPVTRVEIEKIRGVSCDHQINRLLEYDLIKELGRLDAPGRPLLFGTTEQFLRSFGVSSLEELPEMNTDRIADFKAEAEREVQLELKI